MSELIKIIESGEDSEIVEFFLKKSKFHLKLNK